MAKPGRNISWFITMSSVISKKPRGDNLNFDQVGNRYSLGNVKSVSIIFLKNLKMSNIIKNIWYSFISII